MLIDSTYFVGKRFIPNLNEPDVNNRLGCDLELLINHVEESVLSSIFGVAMWLDFKAKYQDKDNVPLSDEYKNIVEGCSYEFEGNAYYWDGLIQEDKKTSLLADLVYYEFKRENATLTTEIGESTINLKAGESASNLPKMVYAYNSFIDKCFGNFAGNADGYTLEGNPFWFFNNGSVDFYGMNRINEKVSLVQFLYDNKSDYLILKFNFDKMNIESKNIFGI